ncbi:hypothetical protein DFP73DRAFT_548423 [Morchella snyderi]|nr:hypothetical protein DFP73DRAFT_548423 [Morchella snyderi]
MASFFNSPPPPQQQPQYGNPNNLQFYQSSYADVGRAPGQASPPQQQQPGYGFGGMGQMGQMGSMGSMVSGGYGGSSGGGASREGGLAPGWLAAFGTGGYEDEQPLLEELGVNFGHIKMKTLAVLNPMSNVDQHMMDDSDVAGPILFCLLFGAFLLLSGKVHFGYIYGVALLGSISLHLILNLMSPPSHSLNYIRSASVLGYCLLPLVFTSFIGVLYPMNGPIGYFHTALTISWCTYSASNVFVSVLRVKDMRLLVAYPLGLFYSVFGIMAIFGGKAVAIGDGV